MACSYCYARRMYMRFHFRSDGTINPTWDYEIRMEPDWMVDLPKKPASVFMGSTMELFGDWVETWMWDSIWQYVNDYPQHTFIFLTKHPSNLKMFSPFPENCYVGVSATNDKMFNLGIQGLLGIEAKCKFISFEPLLGRIGLIHYVPLLLQSVSWVIIGAQTPYSPKTAPKIEYVREIVEAADKAGIPVFLKENLRELLCHSATPWAWQPNAGMLRQEFPETIK